MSNKHFEAADALRRASKLLESFKMAHDAMESIGSIDQAAKEAEARAVKAKAEFEAWQKELEEARAAVRLERGKVKKAEEDAKAKAEAILAEASAKAEAQAAQSMELAKAGAESLIASAQKQKQALNDECAKLQDQKARLTSDLSVMDAEIAVKAKQVKDLTDALDKLKAKLS
jgi:chromosome segregation ATPase